MIETRDPALQARREYSQTLKTFVWLAFAILLTTSVVAQSTDPDDQYLAIYGQIQEGDSAVDSGKGETALALYQKAQAALEQLHKKYPNWNTKLVGFRMDYVQQKIDALSAKSTKSGNASDKSTANGGAQVKLLAAGGEPRKALRLHPKAGEKQTVAMTLKMNMGMKMGATESPPVQMPPIVMTMETTVKDVSGDITYDLALKDVSVRDDPGTPPQVATALKAAMGNMKDVSAAITITERGVNKDTRMNVPAGADPQSGQMIEQLRQSFASISAPLPEEEVGPGARWEVHMPVKSQGMTIDQTATYELVSVEADAVSVHCTVTQRAANQKVQSPAMPGLKLDLTQMSGQGSGTLTLDLGQVMPRDGKVDFHSDISMAMGTGAQKQTIGTKIDLNLQLEGK